LAISTKARSWLSSIGCLARLETVYIGALHHRYGRRSMATIGGIQTYDWTQNQDAIKVRRCQSITHFLKSLSPKFHELVDYLRTPLATIVKHLTLWPELQADRGRVHYTGKLLHRTLAMGGAPDPRYWTAYERFIARMGSGREARRRTYRRTMRALRRLTARWTRMIRGRPAPRAQRAAAQAPIGPDCGSPPPWRRPTWIKPRI
jgi:hypothetical protein